MIKYLILAAGDISKSLQNEKDTNNANHRNMTTDDANEAEIGSTFTISPNPNHSSHSYSNHIGDQSTSTSIGIGTLKLILKSIEPPSNDLITAFEYNGTCCPPSHRSNPKNLIGSIIQVNNPDFCRGILLLHANQCQIIHINAGTSSNSIIIDSFDDEIMEELFNEDDFL